MKSTRVLAITACAAALAACGSHRSVAPVVYGSDAEATARVYNSPAESAAAKRQSEADAALERRRAAAARYRLSARQRDDAPATRPLPAANVEPVELQPVSAIYLSDEERMEADAGAVRPQTQSATPATTVRVARGDTVYALARRHGVSPQAIIRENGLAAPYHLTVGQRVNLPAGANAPVQTARARDAETISRDALYRVKSGDTLYSISRKTGVSVAKLAQANALRHPYTLTPGQEILAPGARIDGSARYAAAPAPKPAQQRAARTPSAKPTPSQDTAQTDAPGVSSLARQASFTPPASGAAFDWPVRGAIVGEFGLGDLGRRNDGINIAAPAGTPVRAAADGEVVYRGSELDGFGNLLLVKHVDGYVTAYAHNDSMLVKKGDVVRQGQVIAKVGATGAVTTPQLHFEIRKKLKSVDPMTYLDPK